MTGLLLCCLALVGFPDLVTSFLVSSPGSFLKPHSGRAEGSLENWVVGKGSPLPELAPTLECVCILGMGQTRGLRHCRLQGATWASAHHLKKE